MRANSLPSRWRQICDVARDASMRTDWVGRRVPLMALGTSLWAEYQSSAEQSTTILSTCMSFMVYGIPPIPRPDFLRPANGIQSTRKAV